MKVARGAVVRVLQPEDTAPPLDVDEATDAPPAERADRIDPTDPSRDH